MVSGFSPIILSNNCLYLHVICIRAADLILNFSSVSSAEQKMISLLSLYTGDITRDKNHWVLPIFFAFHSPTAAALKQQTIYYIVCIYSFGDHTHSHNITDSSSIFLWKIAPPHRTSDKPKEMQVLIPVNCFEFFSFSRHQTSVSFVRATFPWQLAHSASNLFYTYLYGGGVHDALGFAYRQVYVWH